MTCGPEGSTRYTAQGTIRCKIDILGAQVMKLFFTPSSQCSIERDGKKCGVFVCQDGKSSEAIVRGCGDSREIELCVNKPAYLFNTGWLLEIMCKCKVEVVVGKCANANCDSSDKLCVTNIVIPAP